MIDFESMNKLLHFLDGPIFFQKPIGQKWLGNDILHA
jgi:hypothetical protein